MAFIYSQKNLIIKTLTLWRKVVYIIFWLRISKSNWTLIWFLLRQYLSICWHNSSLGLLSSGVWRDQSQMMPELDCSMNEEDQFNEVLWLSLGGIDYCGLPSTWKRRSLFKLLQKCLCKTSIEKASKENGPTKSKNKTYHRSQSLLLKTWKEENV